MSPPRPILVFDGDCGFCSTSARFARRWVDRRGRYAIEPYQRLDLATLGLTDQQCAESAWFVGADDARHGGAAAIAAALRHGGLGWRPLGLLLMVPGVRSIADRVYRWVSANRFRLPGGTPQCAVVRPTESHVESQASPPSMDASSRRADGPQPLLPAPTDRTHSSETTSYPE